MVLSMAIAYQNTHIQLLLQSMFTQAAPYEVVGLDLNEELLVIKNSKEMSEYLPK